MPPTDPKDLRIAELSEQLDRKVAEIAARDVTLGQQHQELAARTAAIGDKDRELAARDAAAAQAGREIEACRDLLRKRDQEMIEQRSLTAKAEADLNALKQSREQLRAAYAEAGAWARHFSTVRMTVTPFLIGISLGVTSFSWEKSGAAAGLMGLAVVVWGVMLCLMYFFTAAMQRRWHHQQVDEFALQLSDVLADVQRKPRPTAPSPLETPSKDNAWLATLVLSVLFGLAQAYWFISLFVPSWRPHSPQEVVVRSLPDVKVSATTTTTAEVRVKELPAVQVGGGSLGVQTGPLSVGSVSLSPPQPLSVRVTDWPPVNLRTPTGAAAQPPGVSSPSTGVPSATSPGTVPASAPSTSPSKPKP